MDKEVKKRLNELKKLKDVFTMDFRPAEDALLTHFQIRFNHIPRLIQELERIVKEFKIQL